MNPCVDDQDADDDAQPVAEDDLSRRFDELSRTVREHLEGLGR